MIKIFQDKFVDTHGRGNCQSAAMASILEIPLSEMLDTTSDEVYGDFWNKIGEWLEERGFDQLFYSAHRENLDSILKGKYSVGMGPSPRGNFWHAVVCWEGKIVFDPHPSQAGLLSLERHQVIVPLGETYSHVDIQI